MHSSEYFELLQENQVDFFTGVPDSLLKYFCAYVQDHSTQNNHIIAANEGGAIALAAGYHLATGKLPLVYMQNSGMGNAVNPLLSLADPEVYGIPILLMLGWRGEPGIKDEPQHVKQGRVQIRLLDAMEIHYEILEKNTKGVEAILKKLIKIAFKKKTPVAIVVKKGFFDPYKLKEHDKSNFEMSREIAIGDVLSNFSNEDMVISTTGKASREVFEYREKNKQGHQNDFLTVGSMGHSSQIAMGLALHCDRKVICIDGDGALIMHLGALAIIGNSAVKKFIHVIINNGAHDSVGGQPTIGFSIDFVKIAKACGYAGAVSIDKKEEIIPVLKTFNGDSGPYLIEIKVKKGARPDLGRPTTTPQKNKNDFMRKLK